MKTGGFVFGGDVDGVPGGGENGGFGGDGQYGYYDGWLFKWVGYCSNHNLRDRA